MPGPANGVKLIWQSQPTSIRTARPWSMAQKSAFAVAATRLDPISVSGCVLGHVTGRRFESGQVEKTMSYSNRKDLQIRIQNLI